MRYPGQYCDRETGLHYNYFRTYDPKTGRYTQGDPIGLAGGFNRFGYVNQDAVNKFDLFGLLENFTFDRSSGTLYHENCNCQDPKIPAFSGNGKYKNNPEFENVLSNGPLPSGLYYIVEPYYYQPKLPISPIFFKLFRDDEKINDETFVKDGARRDRFRFHPGFVSNGCITLDADTQKNRWNRIQHKILNTKTGIIPNTDIIYFGTVRVK